MDMALDDIIMQERGDKQKSKRQLARERLASKKAEAKARRSSGGPQRSRELGRIEIREQAKPYAGKSTPGTVSFTANVPSRAPSAMKSHPPRTRKYRPTTTIFSVFNPDAVAAEQAAKAKPTSSTTARNTNTAASSRNHHVANTSSPRPMPMAPTKVRSSSPPPPPAPKRAISILGEGGPATILVENLHPGATPEDIKTVFARFGPVKNCTAFYDQHGRSTGRAEICYALKIQALSAIKALNNVEADGYVLRVQLHSKTAPHPPIQHAHPIHPVQKSGPINTQRTRSGSGNGSGGGRLYSDELMSQHPAMPMDITAEPVNNRRRNSSNGGPWSSKEQQRFEPTNDHGHGNYRKSPVDPRFKVRF